MELPTKPPSLAAITLCGFAPVICVCPHRLVREALVAALYFHGLGIVAAQHAPVKLGVVHVLNGVGGVLQPIP